MSSATPWGKFQNGQYHHIAHHCADVAACFYCLTKVRVLKDRIDSAAGYELDERDLQRLSVLTYLHDCGKLHPGFQAKGWPSEFWRQSDLHGHLREGYAIFMDGVMQCQIANSLHLDELRNWGIDLDLLSAVISHHGKPVQPSDIGRKRWKVVPEVQYDPVEASQSLGEPLPKWFPKAFEVVDRKLPDAPAFQHLFCGLVSLADWLGSDQRFFPMIRELDREYYPKAIQQAASALKQVGIDASRWRKIPSQGVVFNAIAPGLTPRPVQKLIGEWNTEDQLLILEAETGSGKTEAALWRFANLFTEGKVDSLYFAVPTRSAAKQLHTRVNQAIKAWLGNDAPEAVLAIPGYLKVGESHGQSLPDWRVRWDDNPNDEFYNLSRWAAENTKRYLSATIAVGTVDQAMLAGLRVGHAHLRSAALSRALLVIDEVHASDQYMSNIQKNLLNTHTARGGHALMMSATLGSKARSSWLQSEQPDFHDAAAIPYPRVWSAKSSKTLPGRSTLKEVRMRLADQWAAESVSQLAINAAKSGAKVLVIRNTVKKAIETFQVVQHSAPDCLWRVNGVNTLHHSRFASEDRVLLDRAVEQKLSPKRTESNGCIIIGTQTLEQSLDIDADFLISDLCPIDVLLQRIGRLHRHHVRRPISWDKPQCVVMPPKRDLTYLLTPSFDNGLGMLKNGGGVYTNLHACELTMQMIEQHPIWVIPEMNRFLVESATHPDRLEQLNDIPLWSSYWNSHYGAELAEVSAASRITLSVDVPFSDERSLFPSDDERIRTRLGAVGARLEVPDAVIGPFGKIITSITLPSQWHIDQDAPLKVAAQEHCITLKKGQDHFRYGPQGLEKIPK